MLDESTLRTLNADHLFDGGDLDCGSGLVLLIREAMLRVPVDGILEMRSSESTVADDLPPWCRMVGHEFLGSLPGERTMRYFVRRGAKIAAEEACQLAADRERAKAYEWRVRVRSTGGQKSSAYFRNFALDIGQAASFEERDAHPSAVEYLLSALAGDLATGYFGACSRRQLEVDDVEITVNGRLHNVMAHLGSEDGDPSFAAIELKCYVTSFADEKILRGAWDDTLRRSPLATTLAKATELTTKMVVV